MTKRRSRAGQCTRTLEQLQAVRDARDDAVATYICAHGTQGVSRARIHIEFDIGETASAGILKRLKAAGRIEASHDSGVSMRWGAPGTRAAMDAIRSRNAAARQAWAERQPSMTARALRHRKKRDAALNGDFERDPVQERVQQWEPVRPVRPVRPMSVFSLCFAQRSS
jgi:hypothetical protein